MATAVSTIPSAEGEFDAWARQFVDQVSEHPETYRLDDDMIKDVKHLYRSWQDTYEASVAARDAARAAIANKDDAREDFTERLRTAVNMIQADSRISDAARREAGITPRKSTRTTINPPTTEPIGFVMATDRLEHTISLSDSATPTRRGKPRGIAGAELYLYVGTTIPTNPAEYRYVRTCTRTPDRIAFAAADAGKVANYLLRWVNTKGETGPWGQVISATVPAV